jgi:hypothetical protein
MNKSGTPLIYYFSITYGGFPTESELRDAPRLYPSASVPYLGATGAPKPDTHPLPIHSARFPLVAAGRQLWQAKG